MIIIDDDGFRKPHLIITGNCERVLEMQRKQPEIIITNDEDGFRKPHFIITGDCERVLETQRKHPKTIIVPILTLRNNHENDLYKIKSRDSIDDDATRKPHYIITGNCE